MKRLLAFSILFCILYSVRARFPLGTLSKDQMIDILVDLELAKIMAYDYNNSPPTEPTKYVDLSTDNTVEPRLQKKLNDDESIYQLFQDNACLIYQAHGTKPATFQKSYLYYSSHPELMQEIYELVTARLEELLAQVQATMRKS